MSKVIQVPKGWEIKKVGSVCSILDNQRIPLNDEQRQNMKGHIPYYGANAIVDYINDYIFDEDLILVAEDGGNFDDYASRPIAFKISGKSWVNNHAHVLRPKPNTSFNYVFYSLEHKNIIHYIRGGTRSKLNQSDLKDIEISIPIAETEQHRIAEILSTLDHAIEANEKLIAKEKQIKKGLMHDLLTHGIDEAGRIRTPQTHRYQESELGMIPEGWKISRIDNVIGKIEQGWSPECDSDVAGFTEWGVLKTSAVKWEGFTREENKRLPSQMKPKPEYQVQVGDLLMTRAGPNSRVGVVALVNSELGLLMLSDKLYRLKPNYDIINNVFLALALSSNGTQRYLESYKTGLAESQTNISQAIVKKLLIVVPEISEQQRIADIITAQDKEIETEETNLAKLKELKKGLMDDLLSGRVRV